MAIKVLLYILIIFLSQTISIYIIGYDPGLELAVIPFFLFQTVVNMVIGLVFVFITRNTNGRNVYFILFFISFIFNLLYVYLIYSRNAPLTRISEETEKKGNLILETVARTNDTDTSETKIILDSRYHYQELTVENGDTLQLWLDLNSNYKVKFEKQGYQSKIILFNTKTFSAINDTNIYGFVADVDLIKSKGPNDTIIVGTVLFDSIQKTFFVK